MKRIRWKQWLCLILSVVMLASSVGITPAIHAEASETVTENSGDSNLKDATLSGNNISPVECIGVEGCTAATHAETCVVAIAQAEAARIVAEEEAKKAKCAELGCTEDAHVKGCEFYVEPTCDKLEGCAEEQHDADCALYEVPVKASNVGDSIENNTTEDKATERVLKSNYVFRRAAVNAISDDQRNNLATNSTVTASSQHSSLNAANAVDGNTSTCWSSDPNVSSAEHTEWIQLELSTAATIGEVILYPRWGYSNREEKYTVLCFPKDFTIQLSVDGNAWQTVVTKEEYSVNENTGQSFTFDAVDNVKYVKVVGTELSDEGNTTSSYRMQFSEIEVYEGEISDTPTNDNNESDDENTIPDDAQQITLTGGSVTVSSQISGNSTWAPANAIDGNTSTGWSSDGPRTTADYNEWIQIELQNKSSVSHVVLVPRYGHGNDNIDQFLCFPQDFTIQVSENGTDWETVVTETGYSATNQEGEIFSFLPKSNVKYIKVDATKLNHEGNEGYSSFRFQLMEMKAYYAPITASEAAESITSLDVDYDNGILVLPEIEGVAVEIESSSDENVISKNGNVDIVYGGTANVKLKLTDSKGNTAYTDDIYITVDGILQKMEEAGDIKSVTASSSHTAWPESHLINGNSSAGFWSNGDGAAEKVEIMLTLEEACEVTGVVLYPRVSPADNSGATFFPENFEIFVSKDNEDWTSVKTVSNYQTNNSTDPQTFYFTAQKDVQYVKLVINRGGKYVQLAEVEVLVIPELQTAEEVAEDLTVKQEDKEVVIKNVTEQFRTEITATNPAGIVSSDGSLTLPAKDTEVTLKIKVKNLLNSSDEATTERKLLIKSQATLDVEAVAETVDLIPCPANDATQLTLPSVPEGYTITIKESDYPNVVDTTGKIMRSDDTTYGVRLIFEVKNISTEASALTKSLLVPIYKTYVAPTMTKDEIDKIHKDYESKAYGVFVHYISEFGSYAGSLYADGTHTTSVDELAGAFDAAQFAKDMHDFGVEYVMLTVWHGDARALFPSMTNERWRDGRRAEDSTTKKSYSDRDVIADLLDELDKYDIDLHLYTHPCDGHDFVAEDQALTGWNDSEGNYATWNQFINELYYEVCERYGDRIKGLWFDGVYNHVSGNDNQERLRETCLSFNPAMILTMNTGFTEGNLNPAPGYTCPDYRAWEVNRYVDFVNDMRFSRYQSAIVLAGQGWWTTQAQSTTFNIQSAEDIFQYIVAMASVSTHGGFAASTGFYPSKDGLELNGDYWMNGIRNTLLKVNDTYLNPVAESVKNTSIGKAFPTTENQTVSQLEWGVSTESRDGRYVYLHVLNKPNGNTLTLPETADGTILRSDAVIMNFDGTTIPVTIEKISANARSIGGYSITLPEGISWSDVDTVIRAERTSVTGVILDAETKEMKTEETATLTATVQPEDAYDKGVTWTSSDTSVVTVDENGNLKAVGVGEATITVTTKDGGYTDICKVTVTKSQTPSGGTESGNGNSGTQGSQSDKKETNNKNEKDNTAEFVGRYKAEKNTTTASTPSTGDSGYAQYVLLLAAAVMLFVVVSCYYKRREK